MLGKDKLGFDTSSVANSDTVGGYVLDAAGNLIASQSIASERWLNVAAAMHAGDGTALTETGGALDVNITNSLAIDLDGDYDVGTNATPDSVGIIAHDRDSAPDATNQNFRPTGGAASSDDVVAANVHGLDVNAFGMVFDGSTWDRMLGTAGAAHVYLADQAADIDVNLTNASVAVTSASSLQVHDTCNSAVQSAALSVANTATQIASSALSGRKKLIVQNLSTSNPIFIGASGVTAAAGLRVAPNGFIELPLGPSAAIYGITSSGTAACRVFEAA